MDYIEMMSDFEGEETNKISILRSLQWFKLVRFFSEKYELLEVSDYESLEDFCDDCEFIVIPTDFPQEGLKDIWDMLHFIGMDYFKRVDLEEVEWQSGHCYQFCWASDYDHSVDFLEDLTTSIQTYRKTIQQLNEAVIHKTFTK